MEYLESQSGIYHVSDGRWRHVNEQGKWSWSGQTACGKNLTGVLASGQCIATMIDCQSCKRVLRKDGWQV